MKQKKWWLGLCLLSWVLLLGVAGASDLNPDAMSIGQVATYGAAALSLFALGAHKGGLFE